MLADHRQGVVAGERRPARHHLVEQCPERVEVTPRVGRAAERLLRSHVEGGAKHHPGHREPRAIERGGEPEVAELRNTPRCEPHVPRLDVAVHDAVAMCVLERLAHLLGDRVRAVERQTMGGAPRRRVSTSPPAMSWVTMYGWLSSSPMSCTVTMWGWSPRRAIACAS